MKRRFKIFLDFDGTITKNDVGESIFGHFLEKQLADKIVDELLNDKISSRECWEQLCEAAPSLEKKALDDFIICQEIEPTLHRFLEFCSEHKFDVYVLSDGFDYYIDQILTREKLNHLKVFSNKLILDEEGKLIPSFPFYNSDCKSTANCKRNHIIENSGDEDYTVFIGDGNSDKDPIQYVDFIFAKKDLLKYCEVNRITYFPFKDFNDVIERLTELGSRKRLKKRHQAELKRREAFMME